MEELNAANNLQWMINPFGTNSRAKQAHNVVRAALSALHGEAYESFDPDRAGISMVGVTVTAMPSASDAVVALGPRLETSELCTCCPEMTTTVLPCRWPPLLGEW